MRIDSYDRLVSCLNLQVANLATYQTEVGATAADLTDVAAQRNALVYVQNYAETIDANKKAVFQLKQAIYNGDPDNDISAFPAFPAAAPPAGTVSGILTIAVERNKRFKLGPGYNREIGIALGIDGDEPISRPGDVTPAIELFPAQTGYEFSIVTANRAASDMWEVWIKRDSGDWILATTRTGKSGDVTITPTTPGKPEQIQVRIQLKKNNENYGLLSDPAYVTVNP